MKELKVGMYVRFDYHRVTVPIQIAKIKEKYYKIALDRLNGILANGQTTIFTDFDELEKR